MMPVAFTPVLPTRKLCEDCVIFRVDIYSLYIDGSNEAEIKERLLDYFLARLDPHRLPVIVVDQQEIIDAVVLVNKIHPGFWEWRRRLQDRLMEAGENV